MDEKLTVHCPRCGGLMYKPENSLFYWHADNNHLPCEITNIVITEHMPTTDEEPIAESESPRNTGNTGNMGSMGAKRLKKR
jgi:hypothetical protein